VSHQHIQCHIIIHSVTCTPARSSRQGQSRRRSPVCVGCQCIP
jgi:hypothetical protein